MDSPPVGHRWWLDRAGDLHDRDHGSIHLKSRDAFRLVEQPRVGIVVSDPDVGEKFIPAGNIHGFEAYTRFVSSVERHTGVSVARSIGLDPEAPKPWILDLEANTLRHRETGRQFKHGEYTRVTGAVSGYATRDPNHPWAGDLEIDIEWGT